MFRGAEHRGLTRSPVLFGQEVQRTAGYKCPSMRIPPLLATETRFQEQSRKGLLVPGIHPEAT